jgi:hypothetical protein
MADGTAQQCGRVGSCHIYLKSLSGNREAFLFSIISSFQFIKKLQLTHHIPIWQLTDNSLMADGTVPPLAGGE